MRVIDCVIAGMLCLGATSALAASADCPPLGAMPGYAAAEPAQQRAYDSDEFSVATPGGGDTSSVRVAGRACRQTYALKEGSEPRSDVEIQMNYRDRLGKLGGTILAKGDRDTWGKVVKDGHETWAHVYSQETEIMVTVIEKQAPKATLTAPGASDYRLLGHMPGYVGTKPEVRNFDEHGFTVGDASDNHEVKAQGKKTSVSYQHEEGTPRASDLDIQQNYRDAIRKLGGTILYANDRDTTAQLSESGQTIWIKVYSQETEIELTAIEEKPFQASLEAPKADALKAALDKNGHVALYIDFDFDKATLKAAAQPVIGQVVALLKDEPALKLSVDGHTDNTGGYDYNLKLSQQRAASVVQALAAQGIAADRLASQGFGADKPIADNESSEGRAKNRRVELVKR